MNSKQISCRDNKIEILRGLSIFLVVVYHSIGINEKQAVILKGTASMLDPIIMPCFAFIAGYVFAMRPVNKSQVYSFIFQKAIRILLPFFSAVTITLVSKSFLKGSMDLSDWFHSYFYSYEHFWFLQSIFIVFILGAYFETFGLLSNIKRWISSTVITWIICSFMPGSNFFSLWGVYYLFPIFLIGFGSSRFKELILLSTKSKIIWKCIFIVAMAVYFLSQTFYISYTRTSCTAMILGTSVASLFAITNLNSYSFLRPFIHLGTISYCIYLYHGIGIAFSVRLSHLIGLNNKIYLIFLTKVFGGILIPLLGYYIFSKFALLRKLLLGRK